MSRPTKADLQRWKLEGFQAVRGTRNPYPVGSLAHEEWQHGFDSARLMEIKA